MTTNIMNIQVSDAIYLNIFGSSIQKLLVNEAEHPERKLGAVRHVPVVCEDI